MKKNEVKKVVNEVNKVVSKGKGKKVLKAVGAASIVAGITLVCYGAYKKLKNNPECECKPEKLSDEEITAALDYLKNDEHSNVTLRSFGVNVQDVTIEDVIVNDGKALILEKEGICICFTTEGSDTFKIQIYRDPLYDFMMTQDH